MPRARAEVDAVLARRRPPRRWPAVLLWAAVACLVVATTQVVERTYDGDLATHSDEAAHFVTAVSLLDYVGAPLGTNPLAFAESYYVRYPKLAFGHWPPVFHVVQAIWYRVLGPAAATGLLLVGLIAALSALVLFLRIRALYGTWTAGLSLAVYATLPTVRFGSTTLMPDMLGALFVTLAWFAFCEAPHSGARLTSPRFAWWTAMAILTKASALVLLPFAVLGQAVLGGGSLRTTMRHWRGWAACGVLVLAALAVYVLTDVTGFRPFPSPGSLPGLGERLGFLMRYPHLATAPVLAIAVLGALTSRAATADRPDRVVHVRAALLLTMVWLAAQVLIRDGVEDRYFLPVVAPLIVLFAAGLDWFARGLVGIGRRRAAPRAGALVAALVGLVLATVSVSPAPATRALRREGYAAVAEALVTTDRVAVALVSSDPNGEGAIIAERLVRDQTGRGMVLRASKMLARSDWIGGDYALLVDSPAKVRELLDAIPVRFIVLDARGFLDEATRPHHRLLDQAVRDDTGRFRLAGRYPLRVGAHTWPDALELYENLAARGRVPAVVRVPMQESLGRWIEWRADDAGRGVPPRRSITAATWIRRAADGLEALLPDSPAPGTSPRFRGSGDRLGAQGGPGAAFVAASAGDRWTAAVTVPWIRLLTPPGGVGDGLVRYEVAPNPSTEPRESDVVVAGARFHVEQAPVGAGG